MDHAPSSTPLLQRRHLLTGATGAVLLAGLGAQPAQAAGSLTRASLDARLVPLLSPYDIGVAIHDWRNGAQWGYRSTKQYSMASTVKVITAISVSRYARARGRAMTATEKSMISKAITISDNDAQSWMWNLTGGHNGYDKTCRALGLSTVSTPAWGRGWGRSYTSAADQLKVLSYIVGPVGSLNYADMRWIAGLMNQTVSWQRWGVTAMGRTSTRVARNKNGWVPLDGHWRINSMGHVYEAGRANYTATIFSAGWSTFSTAHMDRIGKQIWASMLLGQL